MKVKLLKKFRQRFVFSDANGYSEMMDRETGVIYGPEWSYCRSVKSVKDHLVDKAIELLTGKDARTRRIELDYKKRQTRKKMDRKYLLLNGTVHPYIKITLTTLSLLCLLCAGCTPNIEPKPVDGNRSSSYDYRIVKIENCEYIYMGLGQSQAITHKGNCNNPIHYK